jgi:hypothetical protein
MWYFRLEDIKAGTHELVPGALQVIIHHTYAVPSEVHTFAALRL